MLVGVEIPDGEQPFPRSVYAHHELGAFTKHFKNDIKERKLSFLNIDNAIFFRYYLLLFCVVKLSLFFLKLELLELSAAIIC